jgi:hypothetical protein
MVPKGRVAADVSFGYGPTVFRVVAPFEVQTYSNLYQLASAMVEIESNHRAAC